MPIFGNVCLTLLKKKSATHAVRWQRSVDDKLEFSCAASQPVADVDADGPGHFQDQLVNLRFEILGVVHLKIL